MMADSRALLAGRASWALAMRFIGQAAARPAAPCWSMLQIYESETATIGAGAHGGFHTSSAVARAGEPMPESSDSSPAPTPSTPATSGSKKAEIEEVEAIRPKRHMFVTQSQQRPQRLAGQVAAADAGNAAATTAPQVRRKRTPRVIAFPNIKLQMMKLPDDQLQQIRDHGWVREAAFKTTPNVTKLEIKAYLEALYGMTVERVATINYLGKKRMVPPVRGGSTARFILMREDDWKKAYVTFGAPPPGIPPPSPPPQQSPLEMLAQLRALKTQKPETWPGSGRPRPPMICTRSGELLNPHTLLTRDVLHLAYQQRAAVRQEERKQEAPPAATEGGAQQQRAEDKPQQGGG